jgi:hypothetical protein
MFVLLMCAQYARPYFQPKFDTKLGVCRLFTLLGPFVSPRWVMPVCGEHVHTRNHHLGGGPQWMP